MELNSLEVWFVTGSQHLYGEEALAQVAANSRQVVEGLNASKNLPTRVVFKPVVTTPESITQLCREANAATDCIGLVCWMHTFSPAKMWIAGLRTLSKPFVHLHTQFNRDLPWATIDIGNADSPACVHACDDFVTDGRYPRRALVFVAGRTQSARHVGRLVECEVLEW